MNRTCREELREAVKVIVEQKGKNEFSPTEAETFMRNNDTQYKVSTIRTHVTSKCCKNAPQHHQTKYDDFERIDKGLYKLLGV